jgi:putative redox protein
LLIAANIGKAALQFNLISMKIGSSVVWVDNLHFKGDVDGFEMDLDSLDAEGNPGAGPRPKPLLLTALAGCTAMDVISILKKMKLEVNNFQVRAEGETTDEHPKRFLQCTLYYEFIGENLPVEKLKKSIDLSQERYCGVYATLIGSVPIKTEIHLNGKKQEFI